MSTIYQSNTIYQVNQENKTISPSMPPQQLSRKRHNQKGCLKKNIIFLHMVNLKELNEFRMAIKVLDIHISKVPPVVTLAIGRPLAGQREVTSCNILHCICFFWNRKQVIGLLNYPKLNSM